MKGANEAIWRTLPTLAGKGDEETLAQVVRRLEVLGKSAEPAIPYLVEIVARNPITRTPDEIKLGLDRGAPWTIGLAARGAIDALVRISPEKATDALRELCGRTDPQARYRGLWGLRRAGGPPERTVGIFVRLTKDPEVRIRRAAVSGLWPYRNAMHKADIAALSPLVSDTDSITRLRAFYLLHGGESDQVRASGGVDRLVGVLRHVSDAETSADIIGTVAMMGDDADLLAFGILDMLRSNAPLDVSAAAAIAATLAEIARHRPSLRAYLDSRLAEFGSPEHATAGVVAALYAINPFPGAVHHGADGQ